MTWTAKVNGIDTGIEASSKGELLRLLKSRGYIKKYWYGEKIRVPEARWLASTIVDLYEDGIHTREKTNRETGTSSKTSRTI